MKSKNQIQQSLTNIVLVLFALLILQNCNSQGWHEGMKQAQTHQCEKMMEPDRSSCLESLDYRYEEYVRETQPERTRI